MNVLEKIKIDILEEINSLAGEKIVNESDLVVPPNSQMGDLSLACFVLAKQQGKNPAELAQEFAKTTKLTGDVISCRAAGPYLNFVINKAYLAKSVLTEIEVGEKKYGYNKTGESKKIMVEYSNGNTHKEVHIGHLRNICYGDAISRILSANGHEVLPVSYINDFGIHVAKTIWALEKFYQNDIADKDQGYLLGNIYTRACQELEKDEESKKIVNEIMKQIEGRLGKYYDIWEKTREWSINQLNKIYEELDIKFFQTFYESEVIDEGREIVESLLKKGVLKRSEGAVIFDLTVDNLGVLVVLRSDGTALYPVADLALAKKKFIEFGIDESIYIVDIRQSQYFEQLMKLLIAAGYNFNIKHLAYDFVKLPTGMMASRSGNIITYEDLKKQVTEKAAEETKKRHEDWDEAKIKKVSEIIAIGALKFEMIKVNATSIITFDINQALRFDGFTAAYLQYTYARINSIIKKNSGNNLKTNIDYSLLTEIGEHSILMKLARLAEIINKAGQNYDPSEIAKYLFELTQVFNEYYHGVPILKSEENIKLARLALIKAVSQVLSSGLGLLGISTTEEM